MTLRTAPNAELLREGVRLLAVLVRTTHRRLILESCDAWETTNAFAVALLGGALDEVGRPRPEQRIVAFPTELLGHRPQLLELRRRPATRACDVRHQIGAPEPTGSTV